MKHDHKAQQLQVTSVHKPIQSPTNFDGSKRRWPSKKVATTGSQGTAAEDMDECDDMIEDDYDSYDELFTQHLSQLDNAEAPSTSRDKPPSPSPATGAKNQQKYVKSVRRFLLSSEPSTRSRLPSPPLSKEENLPWAQRYGPLNLEELAVHNRKVRDVERWLSDALSGRARRSLLILKGPAGSGKTTTVSLLSDKLKFNILEWKAPSTSEYATSGYISLGAQFDEFMIRGHSYGSLKLDSSAGENQASASHRRILLIEEFPTWSGRNSSNIAAFRLSLLRYISMNGSPTSKDFGTDAGSAVPPIVMVVSETFSNSESSFDNLTVYRLLGREIYNHPSTTVIEYNSIAPTFMHKALNLVLEKNSRHSQSSQAPGPSILESISKIGDIRNAIASLEFVCQGSDRQSQSKRIIKPKTSTRKRKIPTPIKETSTEIAQREASLDLFHAVGKIIYNKRDDNFDPECSRLPSPPDHLRQFDRPGVSQVSVNQLLDETGTDTQSFISALHENYVPSCNGSSFTKCLEGCIEALSDSDVLCVDRKGHSKFRAGLGTGFLKSGAGVDLLQQEEISYQVAARGILFALPCPVRRQVSPTDNTKRTNDSYKMSFPPTIRLVQYMEEIQGLVDLWGIALLGSSITPTAAPLSGLRHQISHGTTPHGQGNARGAFNHEAAAMVAMIPRNDLILHQLPYMTRILDDGVESRSLQMITDLSRPRARKPDYSSQRDEDFPLESPFKNYTPCRFSRPKHKSHVNWLEPQTPLVSQGYDEKLFLSDDDIVDDA